MLRGPWWGWDLPRQKLQVPVCEDGGRATQRSSIEWRNHGVPAVPPRAGWGGAGLGLGLLPGERSPYNSGLCCTRGAGALSGVRKGFVVLGWGITKAFLLEVELGSTGRGPELLWSQGAPNLHFLSVNKH